MGGGRDEKLSCDFFIPNLNCASAAQFKKREIEEIRASRNHEEMDKIQNKINASCSLDVS